MDLRGGSLEPNSIIEVLTRAVAIRSPSGEEAALAAYIRDRLTNGGLDTEIDRHGNVVTVWDRGAGPTVLLNTHLDTVPPDGSWAHDPFVPQVIAGRLYGLGAADTKGSLAGMVSALCALAEQQVELAGRIIFTAVVAEETPRVDAKGTVLALRDGLRADFGICGEPTELAVGLGCEGTLEVEARTRGRSAHACDPAKGINAIEQMIGFLSDATRLTVGENPLFGRGSINVGRIEGGVKGTMVPALCCARIGRFVLPGESMDLFMRELEEIAGRRRAADPTLDVALEPIYASQAAVIGSHHPVVRAVVECVESVLGVAPRQVGVKYHADSDFMIHLGKIPTVIFGPGNIDQGHAPDEFVDVDQVVHAARIYARTLKTLLRRPNIDTRLG